MPTILVHGDIYLPYCGGTHNIAKDSLPYIFRERDVIWSPKLERRKEDTSKNEVRSGVV